MKALDPAVGNFKFVESVDFRDTSGSAELTVTDQEAADIVPSPVEAKKKAVKAKAVRPDIRPEVDDHRAPPRAQPVQPQKQRGFFDFLKRKPKEEQPNRRPPQPEEQKKKRFLFF